MRFVIAFACVATVAFLLWRRHDASGEASPPPAARSTPAHSADVATHTSHEPRLPSNRGEVAIAASDDETHEPAAAPSSPAPPLPPTAEILRIRSELAASGAASGEAWESKGYDQMQQYTRELASSKASASVTDYECYAGGCAAEITFATMDDYSAARDSLISGPAMLAWPGSRIVSPSEPGQGRPRVLVVLAKPL
jgi:hypothetical protein